MQTKPTNPKYRSATSRLDLTLFPQTAIAYGALAFTEGDLKYGGYNWRVGGASANVYVAALLRHVSKWYNGELKDTATGVPHLASAIACISVLIDAIECNKLNDDRPPKADLAGLLTKFEVKVGSLQKLFPNGPTRYYEAKARKRKRNPTSESIRLRKVQS